MSGKILIADDLATNRIVLRVKLAAARYDVVQAEAVSDLVSASLDCHPDLIILGKSAVIDGPEITKALRNEPALAHIPVLAILPETAEPGSRLDLLQAGADDVLQKPLDDTSLLSLIRNTLRTHDAREDVLRHQSFLREYEYAETGQSFSAAARIALIAPELETALYWRYQLAPKTRHKIEVMTPAGVLDKLRQRTALPDALIIAPTLHTPLDGLQLLSELRAWPSTLHAAIIVQETRVDERVQSTALDLGASAVMPPRFNADELCLRLDRLLEQKFEADALRNSISRSLSLAMRDPLTGLHNRRYAENYLSRLDADRKPSAFPYALMVLDLDRFKQVNDRYGHVAGDEVLVEVARRLKAALRDMDMLCRFGGEEFLITLPGTDRHDAEKMAERLRGVISEAPIELSHNQARVDVTISIGVAVASEGECRLAPELIQSADAALYVSKADGRNLVTFVPDAA